MKRSRPKNALKDHPRGLIADFLYEWSVCIRMIYLDRYYDAEWFWWWNTPIVAWRILQTYDFGSHCHPLPSPKRMVIRESFAAPKNSLAFCCEQARFTPVALILGRRGMPELARGSGTIYSYSQVSGKPRDHCHPLPSPPLEGKHRVQ